mmetsp:Transcript_25150/g.53386  ORF Transcript_25150/g.53386 Transcript_25150/m.53386 type:complete len:440 (+) Transcript_25150:102-1421(+)
MRRYRHQHSAPSCAATTSLLLATPFANFLTSPRQNVSRVVIEAKPTTMTMTTTGGVNLGKRSNRRLQPGKVETQNAYTEVQCRHWQRIAWNRDEDSSGGLDREEFFGFLNVISLDHFSEDSGGGGGGRSWQDIFNKMAAVSRIGEDTILQVSTDGFSSATATGQPQQEEDEAIDPKIEKEQQKYRDEFCKSIFEEMLRGGVDVATMDLAIFADGIFESDESLSWEGNTTSTTTATTFSLRATTTAFPAATTTSVDEIATSPAATTTTTSERRTTAATSPVTTTTSAMSNFGMGVTTASNPLPHFYPTTVEATATNGATPIITTSVASTTMPAFDAFETGSEIDPIDDSENGNDDDGDLSIIGQATNPIAALEQVILQSNGGDGADGQKDDGGAMGTRGSDTLSTGAIVGVFFGLATMVVSIVTVVTRHPYFDPCERDEF